MFLVIARNAVVTGASSGIGKALALALAREGARVLGTGRNEEALRRLQSEFGDRFEYLACDLSGLGCVRAIAERVRESFSPLDLLVNNAGYGLGKGLLEMTPEEILAMAAVNLVAPLALTRELVPYMKPGSTVVNITTAGIHVLMTRLPLYGATKIGLHYASAALRRELAARGINLLEVLPGVVDTEFHARAGLPAPARGISADEVARRILKAVEAKRKRLYVPGYVGFLRALGPFLPALY